MILKPNDRFFFGILKQRYGVDVRPENERGVPV